MNQKCETNTNGTDESMKTLLEATSTAKFPIKHDEIARDLSKY